VEWIIVACFHRFIQLPSGESALPRLRASCTEVRSAAGLIFTQAAFFERGYTSWFPIGVLYLYHAGLGAIVGSTIGAAIGASIGYTDEYIFESNDAKADTTK
jgi:hypothetical protein